jgi:hypothetical protein
LPLDIGIKEYATDVIFGSPAAAKAALVPIAPPGAVPVVVARRPARGAEPSTAPVPACPTADPLSPILNETLPRPAGPPASDVLTFRNSGAVALGQASLSYSDVMIRRRIGPASKQDDGFRFDVVSGSPVPGAEVTTSFHVVTRSSVPGTEGIFVAQETTKLADGHVSSSQWTPEIKLLEFPSVPGTEWDVVSTDGVTGTLERFHARIFKTSKVDACGTLLAAWQVELTSGMIVGPNVNISFDAVYNLGNQYGGISVMDRLREEGTIGSPPQPFKVRNEAIVTTEPRLAR